MAQAKKSTTVSKKKTTSKAKPRFYVVQTVQEAKENLTQRLETASEKFIETPLKSGKKTGGRFQKSAP